jgi:predicted nucleotidyltransferase
MKTGVSKRSVRGKIAEIVRRIVEKFHPEKIILFGSHARGDTGPDSKTAG